jgi:LacI family transcriptional regulator
MVTGRPDLISAELRLQGYHEAHAAAGVPVDESLVRPGTFEPEPARAAARALLTLPEPPTAIFAANDLSALVTLEVADELGIDVPGRLSVVGFDNIPESALANPPLTTVAQPMRQMGHQAIDMLVALIAGEELADTHVSLDTTLVVRASAGPVGGAAS